MGALSPLHWAIIIVVVLLLFGARLLPRLGRGLGHSLNGLKDGLREGSEQFKTQMEDKPGPDKAQAELPDKVGKDE